MSRHFKKIVESEPMEILRVNGVLFSNDYMSLETDFVINIMNLDLFFHANRFFFFFFANAELLFGHRRRNFILFNARSILIFVEPGDYPTCLTVPICLA